VSVAIHGFAECQSFLEPGAGARVVAKCEVALAQPLKGGRYRRPSTIAAACNSANASSKLRMPDVVAALTDCLAFCHQGFGLQSVLGAEPRLAPVVLT